MKIVVHPQRGSYHLFFFSGGQVVATAVTELSGTGKGFRPKNYRLKSTGKRQYTNTPTKQLISELRKGDIRLTTESKNFESFLDNLQIKFSYLNACRMCLYEERVTPLKKKNAVKYGKELICLNCAGKELKRELGYIGGLGKMSFSHMERLLELYLDLDRVLAMVQPERLDMKQTVFDRIEADAEWKTQGINELPLPPEFRDASGIERLMPVQQICVDAGLLYGKDLLVVAATASGKTFVGEMAGIKNYMENRGHMLFLVPLVALANQKFQRFSEKYGKFLDVSLQTGVSRINLPETRLRANRNINAAIVTGTYEGIDNHLRCGRTLKNIGTVVIDEVQMLEDDERGHRLDGLIVRLKHIAPQAQFIYLSATIGSPHLLAKKLNAKLVSYESRPVPLERHLIFVERKQKIPMIKKMVTEEFGKKSEKGYRGQTIIFTNARARCHVLADAVGKKAAAYHAGLTSKERRRIEKRFEKGEISAVATTAALAAGVDFPASQVIFDSLAMGIKWLTVQEFYQMMGRAGRPDFHDLGKVVVLAEPGGSYMRDSRVTEEEVALSLLKGEMEEVSPVYDDEQFSEEYVSNVIVCGGDVRALDIICGSMVGEMEPIFPVLKHEGLAEKKGGKIILSPLAKVMAEHFIGIDRLIKIRKLIKKVKDPVKIVAELDCADDERD